MPELNALKLLLAAGLSFLGSTLSSISGFGFANIIQANPAFATWVRAQFATIPLLGVFANDLSIAIFQMIVVFFILFFAMVGVITLFKTVLPIVIIIGLILGLAYFAFHGFALPSLPSIPTIPNIPSGTTTTTKLYLLSLLVMQSAELL